MSTIQNWIVKVVVGKFPHDKIKSITIKDARGEQDAINKAYKKGYRYFLEGSHAVGKPPRKTPLTRRK